MSFPRYPTYKDSGVEWLGEVPEHWEVWKLSHAFTLIGSGTTPKTDNRDYYDGGEIPWVNTGDLNDRELDECKKRITALAITEHSALTIYPAGSLLIAMYGATIGKLALLNFAATVNQACCVFTGKSEIASKFMFYWFLGLRQQIISLATGGGQPNISQDILRSLRVAIPPLSQQRQIATFLDHETAKIDALIAEQQRLIELLQEKRQAVISHAVTKGLNPHAPMKDSGVEWLGEVPEHWTVIPLRLAARIESGHTPSRSHNEYWIEKDCVHHWFTLGDVWQIRDGKAEYVYETQEKVSQAGLDNSAARMLPANTVILSRTASVGFSGILGVPMATTQDFVNWVCGPKIVPEFLLFVFRAMSKEFERLKYGSTHNTIYMPDIFSFRAPLPSLIEQGEIVSNVRESLRRLDGSFDDLLRSKELLQERRSALISAAVTGQIDVRGLVPEAVAA